MKRTLSLLLLLSTFPWSAMAQSPDVYDVQALLDFVNDQSWVTVDVLDLDCGIRSDSAKHIVRVRDGKDKSTNTSDDRLFNSVQDLLDVNMVGDWTVETLETCALDFGYATLTCEEPDRVEEIWDWDQVPDQVKAIVWPYMGFQEACADDWTSWAPVEFGYAELFYEGCELVRIYIHEFQLFEPDYGIGYWIQNTFAPDSNQGNWQLWDVYCTV